MLFKGFSFGTKRKKNPLKIVFVIVHLIDGSAVFGLGDVS